MRLLGHTILAVATVGLAIAATPACVDNDQSIYIRQVMAPPLTRQNGCLYTADPSQPGKFSGALDIALTNNYTAVMLVANQMITRSDPTSARADSNRAHVEGAIVRVETPDGAVLNEFTATASGFAESSSGAQPGYGLFAATLIDPGTVARIANGQGRLTAPRRVVSKVKVFGTTTGGVSLESGEFTFPIDVCDGCLVNFSSNDDPLTPGVDCNGTSAVGSAQLVLPCSLGIDESVPCSVCRGRERADGSRPCDAL